MITKPKKKKVPIRSLTTKPRKKKVSKRNPNPAPYMTAPRDVPFTKSNILKFGEALMTGSKYSVDDLVDFYEDNKSYIDSGEQSNTIMKALNDIVCGRGVRKENGFTMIIPSIDGIGCGAGIYHHNGKYFITTCLG